MTSINIAKTIVQKRKEKGVTQEQLAQHMGVTKASVSKWETGQSFPDVASLPQLAAYFNISLDELFDYSPQLGKDDIRKLYLSLSQAFAAEPFDAVMKRCEAAIRKYYSCFPLLYQMAALYVNHHYLAKDDAQRREVLEQAVALCQRIKADSGDFALSDDANSLEALIRYMQGQPTETIDLLDSKVQIRASAGTAGMLSAAYQILGNNEKAREILQICAYRLLLELLQMLAGLMPLYYERPERFDEIAEKSLAIGGLFGIDTLHFNTALQVYLSIAQGYTVQGRTDLALDMLERYVAVCAKLTFPLQLIGTPDPFFDLVGNMLDELPLDNNAPSNEAVAKASIVQAIESPVFATVLGNAYRYRDLIRRLKISLEVE